MADLPSLHEEIAAQKEARIAEVLSDGMHAAATRYQAEDVVALPPEFSEAVREMLADLWGEAIKRTGAEMISEFRSYAFGDLERKEEEALFDRVLAAFIEQFGAQKVTQIVSATRDQLFRIVQKGQREGQTLREIAQAMRDAIPELSQLRSSVIARTETHTSSMYASHEVARTARRPLVKEWMAVKDPRTRDFGEGDGVVDTYSHRAMDGIKVPMNEPFMVPTKYGTKEPLDYPGDPKGSAGNTIMCRCVTSYSRAE